MEYKIWFIEDQIKEIKEIQLVKENLECKNRSLAQLKAIRNFIKKNAGDDEAEGMYDFLESTLKPDWCVDRIYSKLQEFEHFYNKILYFYSSESEEIQFQKSEVDRLKKLKYKNEESNNSSWEVLDLKEIKEIEEEHFRKRPSRLASSGQPMNAEVSVDERKEEQEAKENNEIDIQKNFITSIFQRCWNYVKQKEIENNFFENGKGFANENPKKVIAASAGGGALVGVGAVYGAFIAAAKIPTLTIYPIVKSYVASQASPVNVVKTTIIKTAIASVVSFALILRDKIKQKKE